MATWGRGSASGPAAWRYRFVDALDTQRAAALGPQWRVRPDEQLPAQLEGWLTPERVKVVYSFSAAA